MKALQDLENAASGDAAVRQKIASLPQEVQDVSLLEKITGELKFGSFFCSISPNVKQICANYLNNQYYTGVEELSG